MNQHKYKPIEYRRTPSGPDQTTTETHKTKHSGKPPPKVGGAEQSVPRVWLSEQELDST